MRRQAVSFTFTLLLVVVLGGVRGVAAQDATPTGGSTFEGSNFQQLHITVDDSAYQMPTDMSAGLTVVTIENQSSDDASVIIASPKEGESADDLIAEISDTSSDSGFPSVVYEATFTGGTGAAAGQTTESLVDLPEGDLVFFPEADQEPVVVHVKEASGDTPDEPDADLTVEMKEFEFAGLPDQVAAGDHVLKVSNSGEQPHIMSIVGLPAGATTEQFQNYLTTILTGTPPAGPSMDITAESSESVGNIAFLSKGNTIWAPLHLEPGTYGVVCFIPDPETGGYHATMGMAQVFTVA
jgi:hypothetical protein